MKSTDTATVRCCNPNKCKSMDDSKKCFGTKLTFDQGKKLCESLGDNYGLCTKEQVISKMCCGTGCGYDAKMIWIKWRNRKLYFKERSLIFY